MFFIIIFGGFVISGLVLIVLWHILHFILCNKFDELLFKEPIFNQMELAIYSSWPLSLVRSMGYILLIGAPGFFITKKRFKDVSITLSNSYILILLSRVLLFDIIVCFLFLLVMLVAVIEPEMFSNFIRN